MRKLKVIGLSLACFMAGFGFYRMNDGDLWLAGVFTFGILGILLSVLRNSKNRTS